MDIIADSLDIMMCGSSGGGSSFQRTLLYDSGSYDTYAPYNTAVNLLNNLSDYDEIMIVTSSEGDVVNNIFWNIFFDVPSCLEENQRQSFTSGTRYFYRHYFLDSLLGCNNRIQFLYSSYL